MSVERRGRVIRVIPTLVNRQREEPTGCDGERQLSMDGTSRVSREAQARICERLGVRLPGATRPPTDEDHRTRLNATANLSLGLSRHEEFEETIQTLLGHLLLYVVPGGERLYGHEVAREFAPHCRIFVGRRSPSCR